MGEVHYVWPDKSPGKQQTMFSSFVQAMLSREEVAIVRWVSREGADPKMGVLIPREFERMDCFLWVQVRRTTEGHELGLRQIKFIPVVVTSQMPFADDVRMYTFPSLNELVSKKGEKITEHPHKPTKEQEDAMDNFVDAMDIMQAGDKDENGCVFPSDCSNPYFC